MRIVKESKFDNGDKVRICKTFVKDSLINKGDIGEVVFTAYEDDRFVYRVKFENGQDCKHIEEDWIEPADSLYPFISGAEYNVCIEGDIDFDLPLISVNTANNYDEYVFSDGKTSITLRKYKEN